MQTMTARCRECGTRSVIKISDADRRRLESQNGLERFCTSCGISTRWAPAIAGALWEPLEGHDSSLLDHVDEEVPNILLIDDDEAILQVIGKALKLANCDVVTASSARDAAMLLTRGNFTVIVSDIRMPEFSGIQLFDFLDKHFPEHKERVVFVTGDASEETLQFLKRTNARFLPKPIDIQKLLALVKSPGTPVEEDEQPHLTRGKMDRRQ